jgi:hypothetical protein
MKIWKRKTDNDEVRQYLLGSLSEPARERLERRVLNEAEINEEVQAKEDELIDHYLAGKLNVEERSQFETHFLIPEERQKKLRFGRTLRKYLDSLPRSEAQDVSDSGRVRLRWLQPRPVLVASLLFICLGLLGALWVVNNRRLENRFTGQTLSITLDPGSSRANDGRIQRIAVPASYTYVEVQLGMGSNEYSRYEVELSRERQPLNTYKSLQAQTKEGRSVLIVSIPAPLLEPGDYIFKVSGTTNSGEIEYKDQYQLRVIPPR